MAETISKGAFLWKSGDWVTAAAQIRERAMATTVVLDD
jgi:hypothetical protein